jgi:hypothetical protein
MTAVMPEVPDLEVDPDTVPGEVAHAGLLAAFRAENHAAWQKYRWLLSACRARAGTTRRVLGDRYAPQAAAAALAWSGAMAAARYDFAYQVLERLPMLGEEMRTGRLQESKTALLVSVVRDLDDAAAREVIARILGQAADLTHGVLGALAEKTAGEVDPDWYEARRQAAEARARVVARTAPSGAAELCGLDLPHDPAREAYDHVVALADAVHAEVRARGRDPRVGQVQSHVYLRLLHPDLLGVEDATVVAVLTDELAPRGHDDGPDDGGPDDPGPDDPGPDGGGDDGDGSDDGPEGPDGDGPDQCSGGSGPDTPGGHDGESGAPDQRAEDAPEADDDLEPDDEAGDGDPVQPVEVDSRGGLAYRSGVVVRLGLATLLGRDRRPAEIPGWGTVAPSTAAGLARHRPEATVHLVLHHPDGTFHDVLALRSRQRGRHHRQIVELTTTAAALDALDPAEHLGRDATLIRDAQQALATLRARPPEERPALTRLDAMRRHPRRELDRHVRARDRRCRFPGCSRPALAADLDHTLDWGLGGLSLAENLGALCRYHHRLKHDPDAGWTLTQPRYGHFAWTSPQGARHTVDPPREDPPGEPLTRPGGGFTVPADDPDPRQPQPWAPRRNRHGHITDAARTTAATIDRDRRARHARPPSPYDDDPDF